MGVDVTCTECTHYIVITVAVRQSVSIWSKYRPRQTGSGDDIAKVSLAVPSSMIRLGSFK